ncbi:MAPEG family protein [Microbulbifer hainanensis]|uniref:MAPEG family protein n=1 Tax=Microbulbifer hainanensis TaxID=2735675 RepID=UPI001865FC21|nr:MAPEG family protein [Microbulbifer hainanensis]
MNSELLYLTLVTAFTAVLWVPYILDRIAVWGLSDAVGYPANPKPQSPWAVRLIKAHSNAVENLVVFATLVLIAQFSGISNSTTVSACVVYFWSRVVHAIAYTFAIPWLRTLAFAVGFFAQVAIAWQLLASTSVSA